MAKKRSQTDELSEAMESDIKMKTYKQEAFTKFDEGDSFQGVLVSIRDHGMKDKRTKLPKEVRVYSIRLEDGMVRISGRTILNRLIDEIMDEHGGFEVVNRNYSGLGYEFIKNRLVRFERGDNTETVDGNVLGTYEVSVEEETKTMTDSE
jgi:hypothetical protein